jgi:acetyl-CoA carboxylase biotin carboxyl carrier protein
MADSDFDQIIQKAADLEKTVRRPLRKMKVSSGDQSVELEWDADGQAQATAVASGASADQAASAQGPETREPEADDPGRFHVCSPLVGTFYQAPEPGEPPFVEPGDMVEPGQQVGIVEAMKLMNPVEADRPGRVAEVLVPDKTAVEYGQPLIALSAADPGQHDPGQQDSGQQDSGQQEGPRD